MGWSWVQELSDHVDLTVVTRANNQPAIDLWLKSHPGHLSNVKWLFVDARSWILRLKRGPRGIHWYYPLWQLLALFRTRGLLRHEHHDLAHHVSFMGPGFVMVPFLPVPSVVGPFGGLQPLAKGFGTIARHPMLEFGRRLRNSMRRASPLWWWQLSRTDALIVANTASQAKLPRDARIRSFLMQIGTHELLKGSTSVPPGTELSSSKGAAGVSNTVQVLWGGVHIGWKGLELLLRAIPEARKRARNHRFELTITGRGPDTGYFEKLAEAVGLSESVRFVGWADRDTYRQLLMATDVFVFTSLRETTGAALLEAMGYEKATLVIDHGGPADITTEVTSIKVKPHNPSAAIHDVAKGLASLVSNPNLRVALGVAGRQRVEEIYAWPVIVEQTLRIYRLVLRKSEASKSAPDRS